MASTVPTISLVIPTYNRGDLIGETIDSALAQTAPFLEIIVVDDGSRDNTASVLASFGARISTITVPNGGVQRARNTGVAAARGDYIVLCDSDDLLDPAYLATMQDWLQQQPGCHCVYSNFATFDERGVHANKLDSAPADFFAGATRSGAFWQAVPGLYARLLAYQPLFPSGSLFRRTAYADVGGYDPRFNGVGGEDLEFTLRVAGRMDVAICTTPLVRVRKHGGNDSTDNVRQEYGCVQILEFAMQHHAGAPLYREAIRASIEARRREIFDGAFAQGNFAIALETLSKLRPRPPGAKFAVKAAITRLPRLLRQPLWRLTQ